MESNHLHNNNEEEMEGDDQLRKIIHFKKTPIKTDQSALWARIQASTDADTVVKPLRRGRLRNLYYVAAAAASIALLATFYFLNQDQALSIKTPLAELATHTLPDNSVVDLNAGSKIVYSLEDWTENRTIELTGEAYFDVEKGSAFTVVTAQGQVTVLGTEFNIDAYDNNFKVACTEGRVRVQGLSGDEVILTAGEISKLNGEGKLVIEPIGDQNTIAWKDGKFEFAEDPLKEVISEIERQFDVKIEYPASLENDTLKFIFEKSEGVEKVLEKIEFEYNLDLKKQGRKYQLQEK